MMERTLSEPEIIKIQVDLNPNFMSEETVIVEEKKEVKEREPLFSKKNKK